jgi:hypothetical protein
MLLYYNYNESKNSILSKIEIGSDLYKYVSKLCTALNIDVETIDKKIEDQLFDIMFVKVKNKECLCRYFKNNGPKIISKYTFDRIDKQNTKKNYDMTNFSTVDCEIYEVLSNQLKLKTIIVHDSDDNDDSDSDDDDDRDSDDDDDRKEYYYGENFIIQYFLSLDYPDYEYTYRFKDGWDHNFEKDPFVFFYNHTKRDVNRYQYFDDGVLNLNLFYYDKNSHLNKKVKYTNEMNTKINNYRYKITKKEEMIHNIETEIITLMNQLQLKEKELSDKKKILITKENNLLKKEREIIDLENETKSLKKLDEHLTLQKKFKLKEIELEERESFVKQKEEKLKSFINQLS